MSKETDISQKRPIWFKRDLQTKIQQDLHNPCPTHGTCYVNTCMSKETDISQKRPISFKRDLQKKAYKKDLHEPLPVNGDNDVKNGRRKSKETYIIRKRRTKQRSVTHISQNGTCHIKSGIHKSKKTLIIQKRPTNDLKETNTIDLHNPTSHIRYLFGQYWYVKRDRNESKETYIIQKRPTKKTYKNDLQKRHTKKTYKIDLQGGPHTEYADCDVKRDPYHSKETYKKDTQKWPTKKTHQKDLQNRHTRPTHRVCRLLCQKRPISFKRDLRSI